MDEFEYKAVYVTELTEEFYQQIDITKMNAIGSEGWEFVTIASGQCIFKRKKECVAEGTFHLYKMSPVEKLVLSGLLTRLLEEREIKLTDDSTSEIFEKMLNGLKSK